MRSFEKKYSSDLGSVRWLVYNKLVCVKAYIFTRAATTSAGCGRGSLLTIRPSGVFLLGVGVERGVGKISLVAIFATVVSALNIVFRSATASHFLVQFFEAFIIFLSFRISVILFELITAFTILLGCALLGGIHLRHLHLLLLVLEVLHLGLLIGEHLRLGLRHLAVLRLLHILLHWRVLLTLKVHVVVLHGKFYKLGSLILYYNPTEIIITLRLL